MPVSSGPGEGEGKTGERGSRHAAGTATQQQHTSAAANWWKKPCCVTTKCSLCQFSEMSFPAWRFSPSRERLPLTAVRHTLSEQLPFLESAANAEECGVGPLMPLAPPLSSGALCNVRCLANKSLPVTLRLDAVYEHRRIRKVLHVVGNATNECV